MGYCRASAVRLLEKELLSGKHKNETEAVNKNETEAVNAAIDKSLIHLDSKEKYELIRIANEQKCNDMIVKYFV